MKTTLRSIFTGELTGKLIAKLIAKLTAKLTAKFSTRLASKLSLVLSILVLQSCNTNLNDTITTRKNSENYSYNLSENGCSTELQQYSSLASMCDGLKNESANNFCAYNLRRSKYESDCLSRGPW